jgi:putative molybdopterin biosynthesis protein
MTDELFDVRQVQIRLKVSERTIFNLIKKGELRGFKAGREWRFAPEDIQDYENRQRQKADEKRNAPKSDVA